MRWFEHHEWTVRLVLVVRIVFARVGAVDVESVAGWWKIKVPGFVETTCIEIHFLVKRDERC